MEFLRRRIVEFCNRELTAIGDLALSEFCRLPGSETWNPEDFMGVHLDFVFNHGLPLALIANNQSAGLHRREIAAALFNGAEFSKSRWSEIHACALLTHWGFEPTFVRETDVRTPDLELLLDCGAAVDVEVARAEFRTEHRVAFDQLRDLLGAMGPADIACDLLLVFQDASNLTDVNELFEAAHKLNPGGVAGCDGRWFARALPIGAMGVASDAAERFGPKWWTRGPCLTSNSILLGGANHATPTIQILSKPPAACYEGPIARKANSGQGRDGHPYLIAVDMTSLIGWRDRVDEYIAANFPIWPHVAGVVAFEERFWSGLSGGKLYVAELYVNEQAEFPLPIKLVNTIERHRKNLFALESRQAPTTT